jgi:hypothetical protein
MATPIGIVTDTVTRLAHVSEICVQDIYQDHPLALGHLSATDVSSRHSPKARRPATDALWRLGRTSRTRKSPTRISHVGLQLTAGSDLIQCSRGLRLRSRSIHASFDGRAEAPKARSGPPPLARLDSLRLFAAAAGALSGVGPPYKKRARVFDAGSC